MALALNACDEGVDLRAERQMLVRDKVADMFAYVPARPSLALQEASQSMKAAMLCWLIVG